MTHRLLHLAEERWADIDGYGVGHGFDPYDLPLSRLCNFVWWWVTNGAQPKDVDKFKIKLWRPPAGEDVHDERSPWSAEAEMSAFSALKAALGGKASEDSTM